MRTPSILGICSLVPIFYLITPMQPYRNCLLSRCIVCVMRENRVIERWWWGRGAWVVKQLFGKAGLQSLYCWVTLGKMVCCSGPRSSLFAKWSYRCFLISLPPSQNLGFQTVVLEKTLESPLDCKEIKPVNPKGNQP